MHATARYPATVWCWWWFISFNVPSHLQFFLVSINFALTSIVWWTTLQQLTWSNNVMSNGSQKIDSRLANSSCAFWITTVTLSKINIGKSGILVVTCSNYRYKTSAISIRTGGVLPIEECKIVRSSKNDPNHWQTLCIEEPFDYTNTARSVYDYEIFAKIREVFFKSWLRLKETHSLDSVFRDPLFTQQQQQYYQMSFLKFMLPNGLSAPVNDIKSWGMIVVLTLSRRVMF